jgi:hypothetical protein
MVYGTYNYNCWGESKPTYNWGGPHIVQYGDIMGILGKYNGITYNQSDVLLGPVAARFPQRHLEWPQQHPTESTGLFSKCGADPLNIIFEEGKNKWYNYI